MNISNSRITTFFLSCLLCILPASQGMADETCMSPYMAKIVGQEDFIYVWTLGVEGVGDEQDKLVQNNMERSLTRFPLADAMRRTTPASQMIAVICGQVASIPAKYLSLIYTATRPNPGFTKPSITSLLKVAVLLAHIPPMPCRGV